MDSILNSIKTMLGIVENYTPFDDILIMHINSVFLTLNELGIGPEDGFFIDNATTWKQYIDDEKITNTLKSYMYLKVKMLFDPPSSSTHLDAINKSIAEFEWRLLVAYDKIKE